MRTLASHEMSSHKTISLILLSVVVLEILFALLFLQPQQWTTRRSSTTEVPEQARLNDTTMKKTESASAEANKIESAIVEANQTEPSIEETTPASSQSQTTVDERVYNTLLANNVTSMNELRRLEVSQVDTLAFSLGTNRDVLERIFSMMYAFKNNFHRKEYAYQLQPADCAENFSGTLVFIFTLPANVQLRSSIRSTWGRELMALNESYRPIFIMGTTGAINTNKQLANESREFEDIVLADFVEDYYNLTIKSLVMIRWTLSHCPSAKFVVKVDGDVHIRVANLDAVLVSGAKLRRTIMGQVSVRQAVFRDRNNKWYVPIEVYPDPEYPSFAHGPCYILTTDWLQNLHTASLIVNYVHLEDIFVTDVCARTAGNVTTIAIPHFITYDCADTLAIAVHGVKC